MTFNEFIKIFIDRIPAGNPKDLTHTEFLSQLRRTLEEVVEGYDDRIPAGNPKDLTHTEFLSQLRRTLEEVDKAWQRFEQAVQQPAAEVANPFAKLNKEGK